MPYTLVPLTRDFIPSLGEPRQQVLWVGCSDSDFEETTTLDLLPDEIITLRNIGNMFLEGGITCLSMVEYAVNVLQVRADPAVSPRFRQRLALTLNPGTTHHRLRALRLQPCPRRHKRGPGRPLAEVCRPLFPTIWRPLLTPR